jgi:putative ABC transport system ATP-binding protein
MMKTMVELNRSPVTTFIFATQNEKMISYLRRKITLVDGMVTNGESRG